MSHDITTTVTHRFDLAEREQFEFGRYRKNAIRILSMRAVIIDGSLSSVTGFGRQVLRSGGLGERSYDESFWRPYPENVKAILRAHGIPVAS